eukprot:gb/GEZN01006867.1/.p1 GENE.gb/GEZN01006867.1/~~gb/GEZN01006867.1/.p1  ORF type:complete len:282 (+),score=60.49 gb/GEZN01006867.1/:501-1346(+)
MALARASRALGQSSRSLFGARRWATPVVPLLQTRQHYGVRASSAQPPAAADLNMEDAVEDNRSFAQVKQELIDSLANQDIMELSDDPRAKWSQDYLQDRNAKMSFDKATSDFTVTWEAEEHKIQMTFNKEIELDNFNEEGEEEEVEEEEEQPNAEAAEEGEEGQEGPNAERPHHVDIIIAPIARPKAKLKLSGYSNKYSRLVIESMQFSNSTGSFDPPEKAPLVWVHQLHSESEDNLYALLDRLGLDDDTALFVQQTVDIMNCDQMIKELRKFSKWLELSD